MEADRTDDTEDDSSGMRERAADGARDPSTGLAPNVMTAWCSEVSHPRLTQTIRAAVAVLNRSD